MEMNLRALLREGIASEDCDRVLQAMGYRVPTLERARERLREVLSARQLGLASAHYDFRFSNRAFVAALAQVLALDGAETDAALRAIESDLAGERSAFKPWMFVETGFQRSSEPIVVLAALESERRLALAPNSWRLSRDQLIATAAERIRMHYREWEGHLSLWGAIKEYWLLRSEGELVAMDGAGTVIRIETPGPMHRAKLGFALTRWSKEKEDV